MWQQLKDTDPAVFAAILAETNRQHDGLELIASENFPSSAVLAALASAFNNKYAEGYPGKRYYGGCEHADEVEELARERAKALFGAAHANVQPHAGSQANMAAYWTVLKPGDSILGMDLAHGGHLSHGHRLSFSGQLFQVTPYGLDAETERIDYDALEKRAHEARPKLIVAGASAYSRTIDFARIRAIADGVGAMVMADIAHIAGLVAAGLHPSPVPHAHFVTTTTHKTLRGPRGGAILCQAEFAKEVDKAVFPGIQGGPLVHVIAAKAVAFHEAQQPAFRTYQERVVANASALAAGLQSCGYRIVSGGTDNHMFLLDLTASGLTGQEAEVRLGEAAITVNKNAIPFDPLPPMKASGIRLGTPALTSRGMGTAEMAQIANLIDRCLRSRDRATIDEVRKAVADLTSTFELYPDLRRELA